MNLLQKINKVELEKKSHDPSLRSIELVMDEIMTAYGRGRKSGVGWLTCMGAISFYNRISPIANSVDLISEQIAGVTPCLFDRKSKAFIKEANENTPAGKLLARLRNPNVDETYSEYIFAQSAFYLITGNAFWVKQSLIAGSEPTQLLYAQPQDITINNLGSTRATSYIWNDGTRSIHFAFDVLTGKYIGKDKHGLIYEIFHSRRFNPKKGQSNLWGASLLTPIYDEAEQHIAGIIHNKNLLANGARPSGIMTVDEAHSDEEFENIRASIRGFYQGTDNAGNILILDGKGAKFDLVSVSPKDMDFAKLSERTENSLYSRLKIPKPLISEKTMTYNNLNEAMYQLYILMVCPTMKHFFNDMTSFLIADYKGLEGVEIGYDPADVPVLATKQRADDIETVRLGILTYNEARKKFGEDELAEGGNDVLVPTSLVPIGTPPAQNPTEFEKKSIRNYTTKENFLQILKEQAFDDAQAQELAEKFYG